MNRWKQTYKLPVTIILFGFVLWLVSSIYPIIIDLTIDDRYSLSSSTENLVDGYKKQVLAEVLYTGDLPAGYKKLGDEVENILRKFRSINPRISYRFIDPMEGNEKEVNSRMEQFSKMGLVPFPIRYESESEFKAVQAFPYVIFSQPNKNVVVNIIEGSVVGSYSEDNLNKAISQLEYKFANALEKLTQERRKKIGFLTGHGEFSLNESYMLESELRRYYITERVDLDSLILVPKGIDLLIVSSPKSSFSDIHIFALDHFVNKGGNIIWMIDMFNVSNDSLDKYGDFIPPLKQLGLESLFFKYGVRFNPDLILDLECSTIPIVTASPAGQPQMESFPWYYHTLNIVNKMHPITASIDRVNLYFPSTIDTVGISNLSKTILLTTSDKSMIQKPPMNLSFEILRYPPDNQLFNQGVKSTAIIVEGSFQSYYYNRLSSTHKKILTSFDSEMKEVGLPAKQLFISDSDFCKTGFVQQTGEPLPVGFNKGERIKYQGNEDYILNAVEYMMGDGAILSSKSKTRKLWLIDEAKARSERSWWQFVNIILPLVLLTIFGMAYNYLRKKKYSV